MGIVLTELGRYSEAVDTLHLCKARSVSFFGKISPQVIPVCTKLANALISIADYTGAVQQLREAEVICELRGWKDLQGGDVHAHFGELAAKQGRHVDALSRFERCLAIQRRFYPVDHPYMAFVTHSIGEAQSALGMPDEARISMAAAAYSLRRSQVNCAGPGCNLQQRPDGTPLDQCAGCLRTYYCCVACQTADWKRKGGHKAECKALAAEWKAAGAAAPG